MRKYNFKIIQPGSPHKLRNIDICIMVVEKILATEIAKKFNVTTNTIRVIYRIYMANLCNQIDGTNYYTAVNNPKFYNRKDALEILEAYKLFLIESLLRKDINNGWL